LDEALIHIHFPDGLQLTDHKLALFDRCPRRFFYTHILEIGGRQRETAFMQMHAAVRTMIDWLTADPTLAPSAAVLDERLVEEWDRHDLLGGHGYSDDYKRIARQLVQFFVASRKGFKRSAPAELHLTLAGGALVIRPNEVLTDGDGRVHVRAVRTGHSTSKEMETVATAVFTLAAYEAFPGCIVEFVHLGDAHVSKMPMSPKVLGRRRTTAEDMLAAIAAGRFPQDESPRTCPRCPAFFICGPVPLGDFEKKFVST
jgi:hypothetical protein